MGQAICNICNKWSAYIYSRIPVKERIRQMIERKADNPTGKK